MSLRQLTTMTTSQWCRASIIKEGTVLVAKSNLHNSNIVGYLSKTNNKCCLNFCSRQIIIRKEEVFLHSLGIISQINSRYRWCQEPWTSSSNKWCQCSSSTTNFSNSFRTNNTLLRTTMEEVVVVEITTITFNEIKWSYHFLYSIINF